MNEIFANLPALLTIWCVALATGLAFYFCCHQSNSTSLFGFGFFVWLSIILFGAVYSEGNWFWVLVWLIPPFIHLLSAKLDCREAKRSFGGSFCLLFNAVAFNFACSWVFFICAKTLGPLWLEKGIQTNSFSFWAVYGSFSLTPAFGPILLWMKRKSQLRPGLETPLPDSNDLSTN